MFDNLIESKPKRERKKFLGVGFVSLVVHTAIIAGAVVATMKVGQDATQVRADTTMVYLQQQQQQKPPEVQPVQLELKGFQTIIAPTEMPTNIPPVNLSEHFDPKDYSGSGVEGGTASGVVPTGNDVFLEAIVEEKPDRLAGPQPPYPELLHQAGIQGRVRVQFVVDTMGKAEPASFRIIESPNPGFNEVVKNSVLHTLFRPGRVHGRAVRVLIEEPFDFKLTGQR
jgi:TonB family protein